MADMFAMFAPIDRRIRLKLGERTVADTARAMMLIVPGGHPAYYLPRADFADGALGPGGIDPAAVAAFDGAALGLPPSPDHLTVAWDAVRWFEEDAEIFRHPRNPYVRVDCRASSRRLQVVLDGAVVADTTRAVFLFETGMITRRYFPAEDVRGVELTDSPLKTYCPYKGWASYRHVALHGRTYENLVWFYPEPYDECLRIKGLVSFYDEKVEAVLVDGQPALRVFPRRP